MRFFILQILLFVSLLFHGQTVKKHYEDKFIKVDYRIQDGLLEGKYLSRYANGKKKAEGNFHNNLRVGKWNLWDSTGKQTEIVVREDRLERNEQGFFPCSFLNEKDIYIAARTWRRIPRAHNELLFKNPSLCDTLCKLVMRDTLKLFSDEDFLTRIQPADLKKVLDANSFEIVSFRLKEDWFIDRSKNAVVVRPIGLCPLVQPRNNEREGTFSLGWFYFPELRPFLATQKAEKEGAPVNNLDDVFWYRHFASSVYKENNVYDKPYSELLKNDKDVAHAQQRAEINLIEWEHFYWMYPASSPYNYLNGY